MDAGIRNLLIFTILGLVWLADIYRYRRRANLNRPVKVGIHRHTEWGVSSGFWYLALGFSGVMLMLLIFSSNNSIERLVQKIFV